MTTNNKKFNAWQGRRYRPTKAAQGRITYEPLSDRQKATNAQGLALVRQVLSMTRVKAEQEKAKL